VKATLLLLAASAVAAPPGQPARPGPRTDLVAAPPQVPFFVPFPRLYAPFWGGGYGFYGGYGYPGFVQPPQVVVVPQPVLVAPPNPARIAEDGDRAAALVSATLTLELPAAADVWLDGQKQATSADATRVLASPPMTIGEQYTFRVRAEWVEKGTKYQTEQTTTVRAGERGKLTVYAGTAVK
jgi:uncharacterized protein (TIGR03000 family)